MALIGEPAAASFTIAPLNAAPKSASPVAAAWMDVGPLLVSPELKVMDARLFRPEPMGMAL